MPITQTVSKPISKPMTTPTTTLSRSAEDLLGSARRSLVEARIASTAGERYAAAHLAALRAAAAVLAARTRPGGSRGAAARRRSRVMSVWVVLPQVAPELSEWSVFFAAGARKRAAAEAGLDVVSHREADDLVRDADTFLARVCEVLEVPYQPAIGSTLLHVG